MRCKIMFRSRSKEARASQEELKDKDSSFNFVESIRKRLPELSVATILSAFAWACKEKGITPEQMQEAMKGRDVQKMEEEVPSAKEISERVQLPEVKKENRSGGIFSIIEPYRGSASLRESVCPRVDLIANKINIILSEDLRDKRDKLVKLEVTRALYNIEYDESLMSRDDELYYSQVKGLGEYLYSALNDGVALYDPSVDFPKSDHPCYTLRITEASVAIYAYTGGVKELIYQVSYE